MEIVIKISQFLLSLSLLIVLHEFGHYLPARAFKTRVEKFFLFFDVKYALFRKKIGETVYGIGWLPLGGYVKISGMIDESMDKEQMAEPPKPWEFRSKKAWQRLIIMLGGVIVNFIVALLIYIFASAFYGDTDIDTASLKGGYHFENTTLKEIGFQTGDHIVAINGVAYENDTELKNAFIVANEVTVNRNGVEKTISLPEDFLGQLSETSGEGLFEIRIPFIVASIPDTSANKNVALVEGDILKSINGKPAEFYDQLEDELENHKGGTVTATFDSDGNDKEVTLNVSDQGRLGIYRLTNPRLFQEMGYFKINRKEYTLLESFGVGWNKFTSKFAWYGKQLKMIFNPSTGAYKGVGGFKAIYDIFPDYWSWENFWGITAFLSIMLGVLNLLPIPALDGGHVMFLLWEMVTGRKPGDKFMEYAQIVGFFLLIALLLFANGNDIYRAFSK
ncbi:MAG: RIP metalloprotease RseP [Flavobacteriaceae bacterium]|nr:RIP metalloprotease RseP [Flavobacteriaceae bacterium]